MREEGKLPNWLTGAGERGDSTSVLQPQSDGTRVLGPRSDAERPAVSRRAPLPPQVESAAPAPRDLAWLDEVAASGAGDNATALSPGGSAQVVVRPALRGGAGTRVTRVSSANARPPASATPHSTIRQRVSATPPPDTSGADLPGKFTFQRLPAWWQETFARRRAPQFWSEWSRE